MDIRSPRTSPRLVPPSAQLMYVAAERWRDDALIGDRSLFSGAPLDARHAVQELIRDYVDRPDLSQRDFASKLRDQLSGTSPAGVQLAAELLYVHVLIVSSDAFKSVNKLALINKVLAISEGTTPVPDDLAEALRGGAVNPGQAYNNFRWKMFAYLVRFYEAVKLIPDEAGRRRVLTDWDAFHGLIGTLDEQTVWAQRFALEHLLFPDIAPPNTSRDDRRKIMDSLTAEHPAATVEDLVQLLKPNAFFGARQGVDLYWTPYIERWRGYSDAITTYSRWAVRVAESVDLKREERDYKMERVPALANVFAVAASGGDLAEAFHRALGGLNLVDFRVEDTFRAWLRDNPEAGRAALRELQAEPGPASIDRFVDLLPVEIGARGARLSVASVLLMGLNPEDLPPWRHEPVESTRRLTGGYLPHEAATDGEHYLNFLERLDAISSALSVRGLNLPDRLDVQGLAWTLAKVDVQELTGWSDAERAEFDAWRSGRPAPEPKPEAEPESPTPPVEPEAPSLERLATQLHMPDSEWLQETFELLEEKRQLILQGPPGTGKTFIARALARYLAGSPERVVTVQFHPGSSYEDFVQGLRPDPDVPSQFRVVDGPLVKLSKAAAEDTENRYVLLIDEINRGNVPAIFGELYYLLEYRDENVTMLYGQEHALPKNLFIVGTMNTADRSITVLDAALRRRFYVRDLVPTEEPLRSVLRTFLDDAAPDLRWLADLLDLANGQLNDPDLAIGPSHFMGNITERRARRAWENSVMPTLREYYHGNRARAEAFAFDALKAQLKDVHDPDAAAD